MSASDNREAAPARRHFLGEFAAVLAVIAALIGCTGAAVSALRWVHTEIGDVRIVLWGTKAEVAGLSADIKAARRDIEKFDAKLDRLMPPRQP